MKPKNTYCVKCNTSREFVNPETSHFFDKALILSIVLNVVIIMIEHLKKIILP